MSVAVVCSHVGCNTLVHDGTSRCTAHKALPKRQEHRDKEHWKRFNKRWRRLRELVRHRDPKCKMCGRNDTEHIDHIIPKRKGGDDSMDNLQGLCASCHSIKTARE